MGGRDELAERPGFGDGRRQLVPAVDEPPHIVIAEDARLGRLDDQHALQQTAIHDGHAQKRSVGILAGVREVLESRMRGASATHCGASCSATRPARPSDNRMRIRPTLSWRSPIVAARTR